MELPLKPSTQELIDEKIRSGQYQTAQELVEEAISLLDERDRERQRRFRELKALIDEGYASSARGESKPVNIEEMKAAARAERAERLRKRA